MIEPYFADDTVTLYHGDMRELLPALGLRVDAVITDPPYGETSLAWDRWPAGWPALAAQAANSMWCFGSMRMFLDRRDDFACWKLSQDVVWEKQQGSGWTADRFIRVHEIATHWYRGGWAKVYHKPPRVASVGADRTWRSGRSDSPDRAAHRGAIGKRQGYIDDGTRIERSVIRVRNMRQAGAVHPTEKPPAIVLPLITYVCPPAGTVLDPFAGSCSTGVAARLAGRRSILLEADERYCERGANRLSQGVLDFDAA